MVAASSSGALFDRLVELWNLPPGERAYPGDRHLAYYRSQAVRPEAVKTMLLRDYSLDEATTQIREFLAGVSAGFRADHALGEREMFLADCCLALATSPDPIPLPKATVGDIVRSFPAIAFYAPVGKLIEAYLTDREALAALYEGVIASTSDMNVASCLEGVRLYKRSGRRDPERGAMGALVARFRRVVDGLVRSPVGMIEQAARSAARHIGSYES
jgi:hypothetical protein